MPRSRRTRTQFAIRVSRDLAAYLRSLPNASEFIRQAVLARSGLRCPLCRGTGVVACGIGEHFAELARCARVAAIETKPDAADKGRDAPQPA